MMKKVVSALVCVVFAAFGATAGEWTFSNNTITDGVWTLKVNGDISDGAITVTGAASGSGVLDLRDMTVGGEAVTALSIGPGAFASNGNVTEFYADDVTGDLVRTFSQCSNLTRIEISGDGVTELRVHDGWGFAEKCDKLVTVKLNTPNLRNIDKFSFKECPKLDCPVSDYLNPNVTNIGEKAFYYTKVNGDIVLNNIATIGLRAFLRSGITGFYVNGGVITKFEGSSDGEFEQCNSMTSMVIRAENFSSFGQYSVWKCAKLKTLHIGSKQRISLNGNNFEECYLTSVTFDGPAPQNTSDLDTITRKASATTGDKSCTIYCSRRQDGWVELASELTDEEQAVAPANCFGVYREGSRRAWMVDFSSPFDPEESGSVYVGSEPTGVGTPSPEFGQHQNVEDGTVFSTSEYFISGNDLYRTKGYRIDQYDDGAWSKVGEGDTREWTYRSTDKMQRITWIYELCGGTLTLGPEDGEIQVSVSPDPAYTTDGKNAYTNGTPMTITAMDFAESPIATFDYWYGDVPNGVDPKARQMDFAFSGARTINVRYACTDWVSCTFIADNKTFPAIRDRNWTLRMENTDYVTNGRLDIHSAWKGSGILDLRGIHVDGQPIDRINLTSYGFRNNTSLRGIYADNICSNLIAVFAGCANLEFAELSGTGVYELIPRENNGVFDSCKKLEYLKLDFPNLRSLGDFVYFGCNNLTNDVSTLVPQAATNIGCRCFSECGKVRGKLVLDRCDVIRHGAFYGLGADEIVLGDGDLKTFADAFVNEPPGEVNREAGMFQNCANLTNLVIMAQGLDYIGTNAFRNCLRLKTVTFGAKEAIEIAPSVAPPALTGVTFNGSALTTESLDNLLAGVAAKDGKKDCVLFASRNQPGWTDLADELVSGDEADNAPEKCFGVYREDLRKAYLVRRYSRFDPSGMLLIVR